MQIIDLFSGIILNQVLSVNILFYQEGHDKLGIISIPYLLLYLKLFSILHFFCILVYEQYLILLILHMIRMISEHLEISLKIFSYCHLHHFYFSIFYNKYLSCVVFYHKILNEILLHFLQNIRDYNDVYYFLLFQLDRNELHIVYRTFHLLTCKVPGLIYHVFVYNDRNSIYAKRLLLEKNYHNLCSALTYFSFCKYKSIIFIKCF